MNGGDARNRQCVLFDWGDTVMRVFPEYPGPMEAWPRVEAVEGVREAVLEIRRDALVCLATNAADSGERAIWSALDRVELAGLFDRVFCYEVVRSLKPSAAFYQTIMNQLDLEPECLFMIGDDFRGDVEGATAVGIKSVWLNRITPEERSGGLHVTIHSFDTLGEALRSLGFRRT